MEKKVIKADIYIVPNPAEKLKKDDPGAEWVKERLKKLLNIEPANSDEKMVQILIVSPNSEKDGDGSQNDWQNTFGEFQKECGITNFAEMDTREKRTREIVLCGYFTHYLPEHLLKGKKEGDIVKLFCPLYNVEIELTCNQLGHKYKFVFGDFEKTLQRVIS